MVKSAPKAVTHPRATQRHRLPPREGGRVQVRGGYRTRPLPTTSSAVKPPARKVPTHKKLCVKNVTSRVEITRKRNGATPMQPQLVLTGAQQKQLCDDVKDVKENVTTTTTSSSSSLRTPAKVTIGTPTTKGLPASSRVPEPQLLLTPLQMQNFDGNKPTDADSERHSEGHSTISTPSTCPEIREAENRLSALASRARSIGACCTPHSVRSVGMEEAGKRVSALGGVPPTPPSRPTVRLSVRGARARVSASPNSTSAVSLPEPAREVRLSGSPHYMRVSFKKFSNSPARYESELLPGSPAEQSAVSIATPMARLSYGGSLVGDSLPSNTTRSLHGMTYRELQLHAKVLGISASGKRNALLTRITRHENSLQ